MPTIDVGESPGEMEKWLLMMPFKKENTITITISGVRFLIPYKPVAPPSEDELIAEERALNNECYDREIGRLLDDHQGKYVVIAKGKVQRIGETEDEVMELCLNDPDVHHRFLFKVEPPEEKEEIRLGWRLKEKG